jgi:hypothetical protein
VRTGGVISQADRSQLLAQYNKVNGIVTGPALNTRPPGIAQQTAVIRFAAPSILSPTLAPIMKLNTVTNVNVTPKISEMKSLSEMKARELTTKDAKSIKISLLAHLREQTLCDLGISAIKFHSGMRFSLKIVGMTVAHCAA